MYQPEKGKEKLIDVFDSGKVITREEASALSNASLGDGDFVPATKKSIVVRMLHNLLNVARMEEDSVSMIRYLNTLLAIDRDSASNRAMRQRA